MKEELELKECPFCSSKCLVFFDKGEYRLECCNCPALMQWFTTLEEGVNFWNKRA